MLAGVTHIAGLPVVIDDRYQRQRCAWCGTVLIDNDLTLVAVPVDRPGPPATWKPGWYVCVQGTDAVRYAAASDPADVPRMPPNSCTMVDPAATA